MVNDVVLPKTLKANKIPRHLSDNVYSEQNVYGQWLKVSLRWNGCVVEDDGTKVLPKVIVSEVATSSPKCLNNSSTISIGRNNEELKLNLRSNNKSTKSPEKTVRRKDIHKSTSRNSKLPKATVIDLQPRGHEDEDNGYDLLECAVEREDKRLLAVFKLYLVAVALTVILWSFSVIPFAYAIFIVTGLVLMAYIHARNTIVEENLLVTSTVGIQVQQMNIFGKLTYAKYVPIENIKAVVINEIIRRQRVISYLLIILEGTESTGKIMVPLLTGTLPRLRTIEKIYQHVQKVIF